MERTGLFQKGEPGAHDSKVSFFFNNMDLDKHLGEMFCGLKIMREIPYKIWKWNNLVFVNKNKEKKAYLFKYIYMYNTITSCTFASSSRNCVIWSRDCVN